MTIMDLVGRFDSKGISNLVPRLFPLFEERPWSGLVT
jgi:hypothetical protein